MPLDNNASCQLTLIGNLKKIIDIDDKKYILLQRADFSGFENKKISGQGELYTILIRDEDFFRVSQFGFIGMLLSISGDLQEFNQSIEIIAKKIDFIYISALGKYDELIQLTDEMLFDAKNIEKLKKCNSYHGSLYFDALRNVH